MTRTAREASLVTLVPVIARKFNEPEERDWVERDEYNLSIDRSGKPDRDVARCCTLEILWAEDTRRTGRGLVTAATAW